MGSRERVERPVGVGLTRYSPRTDQLPEAAAASGPGCATAAASAQAAAATASAASTQLDLIVAPLAS